MGTTVGEEWKRFFGERRPGPREMADAALLVSDTVLVESRLSFLSSRAYPLPEPWETKQITQED